MTRRFPDNPIVGVGVVVWKDGKVLLVKRAKPPRFGQWSLPGGRQRLGETVRDTAKREVREETGLEISVDSLLDVIDAVSPAETPLGRPEYHYTLIDFDADWLAGDAVAGTDASDVVWIDPAAVADFAEWGETVRVVRLSAERRGHSV